MSSDKEIKIIEKIGIGISGIDHERYRDAVVVEQFNELFNEAYHDQRKLSSIANEQSYRADAKMIDEIISRIVAAMDNDIEHESNLMFCLKAIERLKDKNLTEKDKKLFDELLSIISSLADIISEQ